MKKRKSGNFLFDSTLILALLGLSAMTLVAQQVNSGLKGVVNQENAEVKRENNNTTGIGGFEPTTKSETANWTEVDWKVALKDQLLKPSFSKQNSGEINSDPDRDPAGSKPQSKGNTASTTTYTFPDKHQRFKRYAWNSVGPFAWLGAGFSALIDQAYNTPREWGKTPTGYGKRFASSFGGNLAHQTARYGLAEAFKLDNRFHKSTKSGVGARAKDVISQAFTSRTRTGDTVFSVPKIGGYLAAGLVPLTWKPARYTFWNGIGSAGLSALGSAGTNLVKEFIFHKK
ncbi:MAG: hypothetical protein QOH96_670 [Blastocatellia bacterium]|jgi:hypothetical protein|nr:hypothetical protein [Blastocatellia bacterium]